MCSENLKERAKKHCELKGLYNLTKKEKEILCNRAFNELRKINLPVSNEADYLAINNDGGINDMKIHLAGIIENSLSNGPGMRKVLFAQGCEHNCKGCFNPETHPRVGGEEISVDFLVKKLLDDYMIDGVTFSGGDPILQAKSFACIAKAVNTQLNVWCYTGYTFEQLLEISKLDSGVKELLENIDVLVDGRFMEDLMDGEHPFRGSSNQRIIDVSESLKLGCTVEREDL